MSRLIERAAQAKAGGLDGVLEEIEGLRFRFWKPGIVKMALKATGAPRPMKNVDASAATTLDPVFVLKGLASLRRLTGHVPVGPPVDRAEDDGDSRRARQALPRIARSAHRRHSR